MKNEFLDKLVASGELRSYILETIEEEPGSGSREADRLLIVLPSGSSIYIDTFCSGSAENTSMIVEDAFDVIRRKFPSIIQD